MHNYDTGAWYLKVVQALDEPFISERALRQRLVIASAKFILLEEIAISTNSFTKLEISGFDCAKLYITQIRFKHGKS